MYISYKHIDQISGKITEHIRKQNADGSVTSFPNVETNDGPERKAYLAWVAEGNTAEEWQPDGE